MKRQPINHMSLATHSLIVTLIASLGAPMPALGAMISLSNTPLATTTSNVIKPNLMLVFDNSGSMDWDHMPDDAGDPGSAVVFSFGYYGVRSSQCNQVYYNPNITYTTPIKPDGTTHYTDASFTGAWTDGFNTGAGTVNLNSAFKASTSLNGDSLGQSAYYYTYSGTQTTPALKYYHSTTNPFYYECHDSTGSSTSLRAPVNGVKALTGGAPSPAGTGVFTKHRIATINTATIDISAPGSPTSTSVSSIKVNGIELMAAASTGNTSASTVATNIISQINANTATTGFSASGPTGSGPYTITITAPNASYKDFYPVITLASGNMTLTPDVFPDTSTASQTNFANWYSFYRTRLLMMKTATGEAFKDIDDKYRVGLFKISSTTPVIAAKTFLDDATVPTTQRTDWYNALYNMISSGSTPLRTALSNAGRYYAGKLSGTTDPIQYSCQQNFAILSTDGYWNTGDSVSLSGSVLGNIDGTAAAPMWDGYTASGSTTTTTYTRTSYTVQSAKIGGGSNCTGGKVRLIANAQTQSCSIYTPSGGSPQPESCGSWTTTSQSYVSPYTSSSSTCVASITAPAATARVATGSVTTTVASGGSSNSLADVAMYYYQTDLRNSSLSNCTGVLGKDVCEDNVFTSSQDTNTQQHMTTFTLGLGASGWMIYSPSYLTDTTGDYFAVKNRSTASSSVCTWQASGTVCTWPMPGMDGSGNGYIANIDDLWHAAVNGHGAYFSATDPTTLADGLKNALSGIKARRGAAAAAATSTLNPVAGNNFAFVASYTTIAWKGNLEARGINTDTGAVNQNASWCVENVVASNCAAPSHLQATNTGDTTTYSCVTPNSVICNGGTLIGTDCYVPAATACTGTMVSKVSDLSDTRTILTAANGSTGLINFDSSYASANPGYFNAAHILGLSQWATLSSTQQTNAQGVNLLNFLRGQYGYEDRSSNPIDNRVFRFREAVLGDALESQPAYISKPVFSYIYPGYSAYAAAQAGRAGTVYMGTNDGMMHAFDAATGNESWAYVPSIVIPNMWLLADTSYDSKHINFVNGSAITSDVCTANCTDAATAVWKTILVGGLNAGGRGYYALDITNPASPALLWEFTTTSGIGKTKDDDLGYSYGPPVITRKSDGTWVVLVTSGYNNASPGNGQGYLYVLNAATGAIISKISTGVGSTTTPSGLAKISVWNDEAGGNLAGYTYGGDLQGNLWRFNINDTATSAAIGTGSAVKLAALYADAAGTLPQPVTTAPVLADVNGSRMVYIGTGKYLEKDDTDKLIAASTRQQTQYGIKDDLSGTTLINPRNTLVKQTLTNVTGTTTRTVTSNTVNLSTGRGWYIDFPDFMERVNLEAKLVQGVLLVPTIVPNATDCAPGGYGWLNYIDYKTGGALNGSGLAGEKYDATIVGINIIYVHGQPVPLVVTSDNPTPTIPDTTIPWTAQAGEFKGTRTIWRELVP